MTMLKPTIMKTRNIIFLFVLALSFTLASGKGITMISNDKPVELSIPAEMMNLAPATPQEATFDDESIHKSLEASAISALPSTPAEAAFDETPELRIPDRPVLAPVTPAEADFTETGSPVN
jgi:hypothetical protein